MDSLLLMLMGFLGIGTVATPLVSHRDERESKRQPR